MKTKTPSLKVNAVLNSLRMVMSVIFPMITYPYVTRVLLAENLGKVNFASTFVSYFSLIAVLGLTSYAAREAIQYRNDQKKLNQFCGELLTVNLVTTILAYVLLIGAVILFKSLWPYAGLLAIYSATIIFSTLGVEWIYTIEEDYTYITIRSLAVQIISVILMFVFVRDKEDYPVYALLNVLASVGGNIFNIFHSRKYIQLRLIFNKRVFSHLKSSVVFFASSVASSIYSNIDTTMLGFFCGDYNVGIYSVSVKIYVMVKMVLNSVTTVVMPRLNFYRANNMQAYHDLFSKFVEGMITILLPTVVGINLVAPELVDLIAGADFAESVLPLRILSFAILASLFATLMNGGVLLVFKKEHLVLRSTVAAAVVNLVLNLVAIPLWKQDGAALTTVIAELVVLAIGWHYAKKEVKTKKLTHTILTAVVGCLSMAIVCCLLEMLQLGSFLKLVVKVASGIITYTFAMICMKNECVKMARKRL